MGIVPEIIVALTALCIFVGDLSLKEGADRAALGKVALTGVTLAALSIVTIMPHETQLFGGRYATDSAAWWFKIIFLCAVWGTILMSSDSLAGRTREVTPPLRHAGEYYVTLLLNLLGMMALVSSRDIVTLYVS